MSNVIRYTAQKLVLCRPAAPATLHFQSYVTRAHPSPLPTAPIQDALQRLISEMDERHLHRSQRWENNKDKRVSQRSAYLTARGRPTHPSEEEVRKEAAEKEYRRMDESLEVALQLNLDPRKPVRRSGDRSLCRMAMARNSVWRYSLIIWSWPKRR